MKEDDLAAERRAGELGRTLEAYARARLSPDAAATARMRSRVLREARLRAEAPSEARDERAPATLAAGSTRRPRGFLALLAAAVALLALTVGSVLAAPGGPLYAARLAIEEALLPAAAEARATAEIRRLDARLSEVVQAAGSNNVAAVASALDAYHHIVDEALAATGPTSDAAAVLEDALERHVAVLRSLLDTAPPSAQDALRHAIERSGEVAGRITGPPPHTNPGLGSPGGPDPTDQPVRTAKPTRPAASPAATPAPANETPRPTPRGGPPSTQPTPAVSAGQGGDEGGDEQ